MLYDKRANENLEVIYFMMAKISADIDILRTSSQMFGLPASRLKECTDWGLGFVFALLRKSELLAVDFLEKSKYN